MTPGGAALIEGGGGGGHAGAGPRRRSALASGVVEPILGTPTGQRGNNGHIKPRVVSKRREKSSLHLQGVVSQVTEQLGGMQIMTASGAPPALPRPSAAPSKGAPVGLSAGGTAGGNAVGNAGGGGGALAVVHVGTGAPALGAAAAGSAGVCNGTPTAAGNSGGGSISGSRTQHRSVSLHFPRHAGAAPPSGTPSMVDGPALQLQRCSSAHDFSPSSHSQGDSGPGPSADDDPLKEQVQELKLQNAVLRKNLSMLQQSVVESMKGNKGQFVGNGIFRSQKSTAALPPPADAGAPPEVDLEELQNTLAERRAALKAALSERDQAVRSAEASERKAESLTRRSEDLLKELEDCRLQLQVADKERKHAEDGRHVARQEAESSAREAVEAAEEARQAEERARAAGANVAATQRELLEARHRVATLQQELEDARGKFAVAKAECDSLREELECEQAMLERERAAAGAAASAWGARDAEMAAREKDAVAGAGKLQEALAAASALEARLRSQREELVKRVAIVCFGDPQWLRVCFDCWSSSASASRKGVLQMRIRDLESDAERLAQELQEVRISEAVSRHNAEASALEAMQAVTWAGQLKEQLQSSEHNACTERGRAEAANARLGALEAELHALKAAREELGAPAATVENNTGDGSDETLKEWERRFQSLEEELRDARASTVEAQAGREASNKDVLRLRSALEEAAKANAAQEAAAKEVAKKQAALQQSLETAQHSLNKAKQAEASASKKAQELQRGMSELEGKHKNAVAELEASCSSANQLRQEATAAKLQAERAERQVKELQQQASNLQQRLQDAESRGSSQSQAEVHERKQLSDQVSELTGKVSAMGEELQEKKLEAAEAKSECKLAAKKLNLLRDEHAALKRELQQARESQSDSAIKNEAVEAMRKEFVADARKALEEAKQSVRIMVTAPKVSVNIGKNEHGLHLPFPMAAIKDSVRDEVMPRFAKVFAVGDSVGDEELRRDVTKMVEDMSLKLQSKIVELMPQAEGTCNWDGFGARTATLMR